MSRARGNISTLITGAVVALGCAGGVVAMLVHAAHPYVTYLLGIQAASIALGALVTCGSLETKALAEEAGELATSACELLVAAAAQGGDGGAIKGLGEQVCHVHPRLMERPAVWRSAGYAAAGLQAVSLVALYLAMRGTVIYPASHPYIAAAFVTGSAPACASIRIAGARQQRLLEDMRLARTAHRKVQELIAPDRPMNSPIPLHLVVEGEGPERQGRASSSRQDRNERTGPWGMQSEGGRRGSGGRAS